jgi:DNA primase
MAGRIPDHILDEILGRTDIVEIIQASIPLKKAGRNFKACCPFHHEKTPSFMVSPDRQIFHCFGCGESGNAFKFLMRHERMDFLEAVKYLAQKAGIILPEARQENPQTASLLQQLYAAHEMAAHYFVRVLESAEGSGAREYLARRGISPETARRFRLGMSSAGWDGLILEARKKNIPVSVLEKGGLVLPRDGGGYYDRFRKRLMFPVFDAKGRVLAFGGRVLDDSHPKYLNSPETPIYTKGRHLFGLDAAKAAIRDADCVLVVEGYLDCIIPSQAGCANIVASLGTALTVDQVRTLKRYTHNIVLVYDGDSAGESASLRSLDIFVDEEVDARIATLPAGHDPDTFVRAKGKDAFLMAIGQAQDVFAFKLAALRKQYRGDSAQLKGKICAGMLATIVRVKDEVVKSEYLRQLAADLNVAEDALRRQMSKIRQVQAHADHSAQARESAHPKDQAVAHPTERLLVKLLLEQQDFVHWVREHLTPNDLGDARLSRILSELFAAAENGKEIEVSALLNSFEDAEAEKLVCESVFMPQDIPAQEKERLVYDCVERLKSQKEKNLRHRLQLDIQAAQEAGDEAAVQELIEKLHGLIKAR